MSKIEYSWKEHERLYCEISSEKPPEYADEFPCYSEAYKHKDDLEIMEERGGFHLVKYHDKYYVW